MVGNQWWGNYRINGHGRGRRVYNDGKEEYPEEGRHAKKYWKNQKAGKYQYLSNNTQGKNRNYGLSTLPPTEI